MAKPTPKKRNPQELTDYSLRGIRNDISDLTARVEALEHPAAPSLKAALIAAESRSAPVSEDGCGCKTLDGTNVTIFCSEHGHDVA